MSSTRPALPEGWSWRRLGDLCEKPQYGWTTKANEDSGALRLLRTSDITSGAISWGDVPFCTEAPDDIERYRLRDGDLVISRAGSVGFSELVERPPPAVFASYLIRFRPKEPRVGRYLRWFLRSPLYWRQIGAETAGIAVGNLNAKKLVEIAVALPPSDTIDAVVDMIERSLATLHEGRRWLASAEARLPRLEAALFAASIPKPSDHRDLPSGWSVETLADLAERVTSGSRDWKPYYGRGTGVFVLTQNVRMRRLDWSEVMPVDPPANDPATVRSLIRDNDLLVTIVGANCGNVARVPTIGPQHYVCQSLALVRLKDPDLSRYVELYLASPSGGQLHFEECYYGQGRPHLSFEDLKRMPIPLPSSGRYEQLVGSLSDRLAAIEVQRASFSDQRSQIEILEQSLIHDAVTGRLALKEAA